MATAKKLRVRRSLLELQKDYAKGNKKPLEDLMRAWKGIKELPYDDQRSFFKLGGFHGEPFRGPGMTDSAYWGGYCNHGNVLFPTWHRVYLLKLEEALQSIKGCKDVMLPYWDETDEESLKNGIPWALTIKDFVLDGVTIPNPLRSFVFPVTITDKVTGDDSLYTKGKGYETVRYPLSGLVGTPEAQQQTDQHNAQYPDYDKNVQILNGNIVAWLNDKTVYIPTDGTIPGYERSAGVLDKYRKCLNAPNYTVFSNTTSAKEWNSGITDPAKMVVPLESPHNDIHLAVGGFDVPSQNYDASPIPGANGDMGENDTAGLDPIFYFHHCNVDRVFWLWQKQNKHTDDLEIIPFYNGTNSNDSQNPTPGFPPNTLLGLDSPLFPFTREEKGRLRVYTSLDCINIEKQLGMTYSPGSLEEKPKLQALAKGQSTKILHVSKINRAEISGSFVVSAFAVINGERHFLGSDSVLSRWNVIRCENCQRHLEVKASFPLQLFKDEHLQNATYEVKITSREVNTNPVLKASATPSNKQYHLEVR